MGSYDYGKQEVCKWIRGRVPINAEVLDVGACDGKWRLLLSSLVNMDACEIYPPNAERVRRMYRNTFVGDIADFKYDHYDLVIFGDVIEHMTVEHAQAVLDYAVEHAGIVVVGVPFLYPQGEVYGNKWETHLQPDLTPEVFGKRYPKFKVLHKATDNYWYYVNRGATIYECFHCGEKAVIWDGDYREEGEGIIHECHCTNCGARVTYRISLEGEDYASEES